MSLNWFIIWAFIATSSAYDGSKVDHTGCPVVFKGLCHCGKQHYKDWKPQEEVYVVNCTNAGFESTHMLELLPNGTQVLLFNGNNLGHLEWNLLGVWDDHVKLEVLDLSNNRITDITGKSFHRVAYVKRLRLDHNNLKISGTHFHRRLLTNFVRLEELHLTNAFTEVIDSKWYLDDLVDILLASNMTNLYKLHLEQNEIWSITNNTFCGLPALSDLYLGDNQLTDLDFNFECIKNLRFLDVRANKIKRLDMKTLKRIDSVFAGHQQKKINLNLNPWVCDCNLKKFDDWMKSTTTSFYQPEKLRCYKGFPEVNAGIRISNVQSFDCPPGKNSVELSLLGILSLVVFALIVIVIVLYRKNLKKNIEPLIVNFRRSMQYSSIEKAFNDPPTSDVIQAANGNNRGMTSSALPPAVSVWVNPISDSFNGRVRISKISERPTSRYFESSEEEDAANDEVICQGSILGKDCQCHNCKDSSGFYWG